MFNFLKNRLVIGVTRITVVYEQKFAGHITKLHKMNDVYIKIYACFRGFDQVRIIGQVYEKTWLTKWFGFLGRINFLFKLLFKLLERERSCTLEVTIDANKHPTTTIKLSRGFFDFTLDNDIKKEIHLTISDLNIQETINISNIPVFEDKNAGLISDIDDTLFTSHSSRKIRKVRHFIMHKISKRLPNPGLASFFEKVQQSSLDTFYVSSSRYILYDLIKDFLRVNHFPANVLLLKSRDKNSVFDLKHGHKKKRIKELLEMFPNKKFILLGDAGQEDPIIYKQIHEEFPDRIRLILIREIQKSKLQKLSSEHMPFYSFKNYSEVVKLIDEL